MRSEQQDGRQRPDDQVVRAALARLREVPGTVSWWAGPVDGPAWVSHDADAPHHAASTMKLAVLVAAWRAEAADPGWMARRVRVHDGFASAAAGHRFEVVRAEDSDDAVWEALGRDVPLRWLVGRMVVASSNLATDLVLEVLGLGPARRVLADAGCRVSTLDRPVDDVPAARAGLGFVTSAADLAALLGGLASGRLLPPAGTAQALADLGRSERTEDVVRGLPPGTPVAHKNGWDVVDGLTVRHSVALVRPAGGVPFVQAVCTTTPLPDADACALVADLTRALLPG